MPETAMVLERREVWGEAKHAKPLARSISSAGKPKALQQQQTLLIGNYLDILRDEAVVLNRARFARSHSLGSTCLQRLRSVRLIT